MKNGKKSLIGKQLLELTKRELFAIIAVGMVLILLFGKAMASTLEDGGAILGDTDIESELVAQTVQQTMADVSSPAGGQLLMSNSPTIQFGTMVKGYDRKDKEEWTSTIGVKNMGSYLKIAGSNTVIISGVNNGTYNVWVMGFGNLIINNVPFTFKTIRTINKSITITDQTLTINFADGVSQIRYISTLPLDKESSEDMETLTPGSLAVLPNSSTVILNPSATITFRPLVIIISTTNRQMSPTPNQLIWSSNNTSVATVDTNGLVTAHTPGLVTITVQVANTNLVASTSISVRAMIQAPVIDITAKTQAVTPTEEKATTPVISEQPADTISNPVSMVTNFVTSLLNLKPSEAAKSNLVTEPPTITINLPTQTESDTLVPSTDTTSIQTTFTSLIAKVTTTIQKGIDYVTTLSSQTFSLFASWIKL